MADFDLVKMGQGTCSWEGQTLEDVQDFLRDWSPDQSDCNVLLISAAKAGLNEIVKLLIPVSDPLYNNSWALRVAAGGGHLDVVETLIPVTDPMADESVALGDAALHGHMDVVKRLIPVSNVNDYNAWAFTSAIVYEHLDVARLLLDETDITGVGNTLIQNEKWGKLDSLIVGVFIVGGDEPIIDEWLADHADNLPLSSVRKRAKNREKKAGTGGTALRTRSPRVRC